MFNRLRETLFKGLFRARYRYDVFISYSHKDTEEYARNLKRQLAALDFSCFIDEEESPPGLSLDPTLEKALRKSAALVLLATERALTRPYIALEFEKFLSTGRRIIPINISEALTRKNEEVLTKTPWNIIKSRKLIWIDETDDAFAKKNPSPPIADGIDKLFKYTRRNVRVRAEIIGTAALVLLLAVGAGFVIKGKAAEVSRQSLLAATAKKDAERQQGIATAAGKEAQKQLALAAEATKKADEQQKVAETAKKEAERQQEIARTATNEADKQLRIANDARLEADRQLERGKHLRYVSDITLAQRAYDAGDTMRASQLLEPYSPSPSTSEPADLRGFEWYYLWHLIKPDFTKLDLTEYLEPGAIAYSPDGKKLALGGSDNIIVLWDLVQRKKVATLRNVPTFGVSVDSVAFSPDGKFLASASDTGVYLWDGSSGRKLATLDEHKSSSVSFSPDGRILASAGSGVKFWELDTRKQILSLDDATGVVAFSPDGKMLVTGVKNGDLDLWDVGSRTKQGTLKGHKYTPNHLAFSPDGKFLATESIADATVRIWKVETQKELALFKDSQLGAFSPVGQMLAIYRERQLKLLDSETLSTLANLPSMGSAIAFSPDGKMLASFDSSDLYLLDVSTQREQATLHAPGYPIDAVTYSPDSKTLAVVDGRQNLGLWNIGTRKENVKLQANSMAFSPDGRYIATGDDSSVKLWDAAATEALATFSGGGLLVFSRDSKRLMVVSVAFSNDPFRPPILTVWDMRTRQKIGTSDLGMSFISCIALSSDDRTLAVGNEGGRVLLWDTQMQKEIGTLTEPSNSQRVLSLAFSPDGRILAWGSWDGTIKLWDTRTHQEITTLGVLSYQGHPVNAVAFSTDGKTLVSGNGDKTVKFWDMTTYQETMTISGFALDVTALAFSPDDKILAVGSYDGSVRLFFGMTDRDLRLQGARAS
jgi:WD40 repeat protein